jgi:hypothetical protein
MANDLGKDEQPETGEITQRFRAFAGAPEPTPSRRLPIALVLFAIILVAMVVVAIVALTS